jgi:hypothetical protein
MINNYEEYERNMKIEKDRLRKKILDDKLEELKISMVMAIENSDDNEGKLVKKIAQEIADNKFARNSIVHHVQIIDKFKHMFHDSIKDIESALKTGKNCIYVVMTDKYMVCDNLELYGSFLSHCGQFEDTEVNRFNVIHYQIVPNNNRQKLVLCCDNVDPDALKEIDNQIKKCFNVECKWIYNTKWNAHQITVDLIIDTFSDNEDHYVNLYGQMQTNNVASRASVTIPPVINNMDISLKYALFQLLQDRHANESLEASLVYAPVINITINNNIGTVNIINNYTKNNNADKEKITTDWISNNLPHDKQGAADYYKQYTDSTKNGLSIQKFTKILKTNGYRHARSGTKVCWVRK